MRVVLVLFFVLLVAGCGGYTVEVKGSVKDPSGSPLSGAEVRIEDTDRCCPGEDKPCIYSTNDAGVWSLSFSGGRENKDAPESRLTCNYSVSKTGYNMAQNSFSFCERGSCSGDQNLTTEVNLSAN